MMESEDESSSNDSMEEETLNEEEKETLYNDIIGTIHWIIRCSGGFTNEELLDEISLGFITCANDTSDEIIMDLFDDDDNWINFDKTIMNELNECKTPPIRFIHNINADDLDRILSGSELCNAGTQEKLVKDDIYKREIKELGLNFHGNYIPRTDPFETLVEEKISKLIKNRRKEIEKVIKKNRNKRQKLNNPREVDILCILKTISKNVIINKQKKWNFFK